MESKPLRLKRQTANAQRKEEEYLATAEVLVNTDIPFLDHPFSYGIPASLRDLIRRGSLVQVPFKETFLPGIVKEVTERKGINRPIIKVISSLPLSEMEMNFLEIVSNKYGASFFDMFRFFVPGFFSLEKFPDRRYLLGESQMPTLDLYGLYPTMVSKISEYYRLCQGNLLVIFPTAKSLRRFIEYAGVSQWPNVIIFDSLINVSNRRATVNKIRSSEKSIIIGLRGASFLNIGNIDSMIVVDEIDSAHAERRTPYWHTREIALMRMKIEGLKLVFLSSVPSPEIFLEIQQKLMSAASSETRYFNRKRISTIEDDWVRLMRSAQRHGPLLIVTAQPGNFQASFCSRCGGRPQCQCGGFISPNKSPGYSCKLCYLALGELVCTHCASKRFQHLFKGGDQLASEIGKQFPHSRIVQVHGEKEAVEEIADGDIVISTYGVAPIPSRGYSGVVLLDGQFLSNLPYLDSELMLRYQWFSHLSLLSSTGFGYLSLPSSHRIVQAILAKDPLKYLDQLLQEREESQMPPYSKIINITGKRAQLVDLRQRLEQSFNQQIQIYDHDSSIILKIPVRLEGELVDTLAAFQKYLYSREKESYRFRIGSQQI